MKKSRFKKKKGYLKKNKKDRLSFRKRKETIEEPEVVEELVAKEKPKKKSRAKTRAKGKKKKQKKER